LQDLERGPKARRALRKLMTIHGRHVDVVDVERSGCSTGSIEGPDLNPGTGHQAAEFFRHATRYLTHIDVIINKEHGCRLNDPTRITPPRE